MKYNTVKSSIFGTKLMYVPESEYAKQKIEVFKMPRHSMFKIKAVENGFVFTQKGKIVTPPIKEVYIDNANVVADLLSGSRIALNLELGHITPEYVSSGDDYIVANDGKIYNISPTKATTFSGYTACMEPSQYSEVFPMYLDRLEILICKNNDGTYELRNTKNFDLVIDTKFSSQDIHITHYCWVNDNKVRIFMNEDVQYITDDSGKVLKTFPASMKFVTHITNGIISYDENNNTSIVVSYNPDTKEIKETTLQNKIIHVYNTNGSTFYTVQSKEGMGIVDVTGKVIVPIKYERVSLEELSPRSSFGMDREERSVFTVIDKNKKCGVYSLDGKQLVATMYDDIHCDKSGRMDNGLYKFVVSQDNLFGVINSNGRVEVPFEYRFPSKGCGCYTFQEDGVSRLEIADNNGKEAYFNIFEKNIVASEEDVLSIKQYESGLRKVTEKNKSKTKTVTKTVSKYSEDEVAGIGLAATIVTGNPLVGMYVAGLASDASEVVTTTVTEAPGSDDDY